MKTNLTDLITNGQIPPAGSVLEFFQTVPVEWAGCDKGTDDMIGQQYAVDRIEVHSWHTKVYLREIPGRAFNSVSFLLLS